MAEFCLSFSVCHAEILMRRATLLLSVGLTTLSATAARRKTTGRITHPVRAGRVARTDRDTRDGAGDGRGPRQGRQFQELALAVSDLHHRQRLGDGDRPLSRRYRRLLQHDLYRLSGRARGRHRHPVPRDRSGARRRRRAFRRRLSERRNHPEDGARQGLQHRRDRQGRPYPDFRPHRQDRRRRPAFDRDRRCHRRQERRAAVRGDEGRARPRPIFRSQRPRAATTARPAMPRRRARWCRTPPSRPISPTSPPRWCCRCSRRATSRSCWCSGRAIPTAASTTTATASTP